MGVHIYGMGQGGAVPASSEAQARSCGGSYIWDGIKGGRLPAAAERGPVAFSNRILNAAITLGTVSPCTVLVSKNFDTSSIAASNAGNDVA